MSSRRVVLVTGIAGNLGRRLLPQLDGFEVIGVDMAPPTGLKLAAFRQLDLGRESSCHELVRLLQQSRADAVVHLAFVIDPLRTGVLDVKRMWQINVAGTARVMEAISEANRPGGTVRQFIFPSSVSAYGSELPHPAREGDALRAHTLTYAVHKRESDEVVQFRAASLGECHTYILRPHIYTGASMDNYLVGALRGTPSGRGRLAALLRQRGKRLPMLQPLGSRYRGHRFQLVHVDDVARLIAYILRRDDDSAGVTVLNVAAPGEALTLERCAEMARNRVLRLPTALACRAVLEVGWRLGISGIPPDATPYVIGSYTMDTARLRAFLGADYPQVMRYTVEESLRDTFRPTA